MAGLNQFTNNASTTLASNVLIGATSLTVATGYGSLFPTLAGSQYFYCTLSNAAATLIEIVKVTARTSDTFTIVRGQDGTSAQAWTAGDKVELRLTAADLQNFPQLDSTNTFANAQTFSATPVFSAGITSTATPVGVASGGTGLGTLTANNVILGNGTSAPTFVAPSTAGNVLSSNGTTWVSTTPASGARSGADYATLSTGTPNITLTSSSNQTQIITATADGQSLTLPDATTMTKGSGYFYFYNTSNFPVALKDNSGIVREYLYPSATGSPIAAVCLNLQENSTANGVWHVHNPINAGTLTSASYTLGTSSYSLTGNIYGLCQVTDTQWVLYGATSVTNTPSTVYVRLVTLNRSTLAITMGTEISAYTYPAIPGYAGGGARNINNMSSDSNGSDRGIIGWGGSQNNGGENFFVGYLGFAIVSGTLYVSSATYDTVGAYGGINGTCLNTYTGSNNCFWHWEYYRNGGASIASAYLSGVKVNVSGTTVSLASASGGVSYGNVGSANGWYLSLTSPTTMVVDASTTGTSNRHYVSYNTSTNAFTSGSRSTTTTQIAGSVLPDLVSPAGTKNIIYSSDGTRLINGNTVYAIANPGAATVTVTGGQSYNWKSFASKSYSTATTSFSLGTYYATSSSSYAITDTSGKIVNGDPTNNNFNFNYAGYTPYAGSSNYWTTGTLTSFYSSGSNLYAAILTPATPFVS